jgi:hypothetical protein
LPWLFLAACPFMHFFMHHGHGGHDHRDGRGGAEGRPNAAPGPGSTAPPGPGDIGHGSKSRHHHGGQS